MDNQSSRRWISIIESVFGIMLLTIVIVLLAYGSYALWDTMTVVEKASPVQYGKYKPKEDSLTFSELQKKNHDTVGWLTVYGTNVDYPLMQAEDNNKYLTNDAEEKYSLSGAIFLDYRNDKSFTDFNSLIYGHHMAYHAMFGDISEFKDKAFFDERKYGNLFYDGKDHGIEWFAFAEVDAYASNLYIPAVTGAAKAKYIEDIYNSAMYKRETDVTEDDKLVLLSTCTDSITNGRHILIGRINDTVYTNTFAEADKNRNKQSSVIETVLRENRDILPFMVLGILMILLIAAVMVSSKRGSENRRS